MKQLHRKPIEIAFWVTTTLSIIGMVFQFLLLKDFGLNYFNFAETSDLLIAAGIAITAFFDLSAIDQILTSMGIVAYFAVLIFLAPLENRMKEKKITTLQEEKRLIAAHEGESSKTHQNIHEIETKIGKLRKNQNFARKFHIVAKPVLWLMLTALIVFRFSDTAEDFMRKIARAEIDSIDLTPLSTRTTIPQLAEGNKFYLVASTSQFYFVYERYAPKTEPPKIANYKTHIIPRNAVSITR